MTHPSEPARARHDGPATWSDLLDGLAAQVDLQENCIRLGHAPPPDLDIEPPPSAPTGDDRLRALELFERCEALALDAARSLASTRRGFRSAYAEDASTSSTSITSVRS